MSIRGDITCIYTTRRKCSTNFTGNTPASKGTVEPSSSRIWILTYRKTLFFHGEVINILKTVFPVSRRIVNYSQCSEILIHHELWRDEVAINKYDRLVNERIRFNNFVRGAPYDTSHRPTSHSDDDVPRSMGCVRCVVKMARVLSGYWSRDALLKSVTLKWSVRYPCQIFCMSDAGIQLSKSLLYPFQRTKCCLMPRLFLVARILSIWNCVCFVMRTGVSSSS